MSCPLYGPDRSRCCAVQPMVTPSLHERERYCTNDSYRVCPTLRLRLARGRPLSEDDYLALWMPAPVADR